MPPTISCTRWTTWTTRSKPFRSTPLITICPSSTATPTRCFKALPARLSDQPRSPSCTSGARHGRNARRGLRAAERLCCRYAMSELLLPIAVNVMLGIALLGLFLRRRRATETRLTAEEALALFRLRYAGAGGAVSLQRLDVRHRLRPRRPALLPVASHRPPVALVLGFACRASLEPAFLPFDQPAPELDLAVQRPDIDERAAGLHRLSSGGG